LSFLHWYVLQDVSGGLPVKVESPFGGELPLYGMQIDLEQARTELRAAVAGGGTAGAPADTYTWLSTPYDVCIHVFHAPGNIE
jgi:hypothetical protein